METEERRRRERGSERERKRGDRRDKDNQKALEKGRIGQDRRKEKQTEQE
jgi:hypothetical protein